MAVLHEYDYIFAIGTMFAMLDAYNNGASTFWPHLPFFLAFPPTP